MFDKFQFYIILYTNDGTANTVEHMAGFEQPPTINETHDVLTDAIENNHVPHATKPVYMCQMTADQAQEIFLGS